MNEGLNRDDAGDAQASDTPPEEFVDALLSLRPAQMDPTLRFRETSAPTGLAPWSAAVEVVVEDEGVTAGRSVLVILYNPENYDLWGSAFRLVGYARMEIDEDQSVDPLLGEVIWQTLMDSLPTEGGAPLAFTGTVTRELSETFGGLDLEHAALVAELRCSWSPATTDLKKHLEGWGEALRLNSGVSPHNVNNIQRR